MLTRTSEYYKSESQQKITSLNLSEFMIAVILEMSHSKATKRLEQEHALLTKICDSLSVTLILTECEKEYVGQHLDKMYIEFEPMIVSEQFEGASTAANSYPRLYHDA